jgi:alpha-D-ribose 1-methylphosphonate 5-triphosphate diphosphatase PhnM
MRKTGMFDHQHLLKHGVAAQGVVTKHKEIDHNQFGSELDYSIHVRVRFADGTETEIVHRWTKRAKVGLLRVGDKVPVRYDPDDHSKVAIDMPALEAVHEQQMAEAKATVKRYEQERIAKAQAEIAAQAEHKHKHHG